MGVLQVEHNDQAQPSLHNESLDVRKAVGEATLERAFQNLDSGNFRVDPEPPDTLPGQINTLDNLNLADSMTPRIKRRRRARLRDNNTQPYPIPEVRTPEGSTEYIPSKEIISALQAQLELDDKSSEIRIIDNKNKFWVSTL